MTTSHPSKLHRKLLMRRSCRAFSSEPLAPDHIEVLERAVASAPSVGGRRSGWARVVTGEDRVDAVIRALLSGMAGKINLWLPRGGKPAALVVCCGDPSVSPVRDGRYLYNVDAALAGEAAVIAAACRGIESVWMAGIGEREVVREMDLSGGQRVLAVIAMGHARSKRRLWDGITQRVVSGKRRPLAAMAHQGRFGAPLAVRPPDPVKRQEMLELAGGPLLEDLEFEMPPLGTRFEGIPNAGELRIILDAARWSPNAENAQIWRFVSVPDESRRGDVLRAAGAPDAVDAGEFLLLACCAAPFIISRRTSQQPFSLIDVPIAVLHAAAVAHDLGYGWNFLVDVDAEGIARSLDIPGDHTVVGLLMLGRVADEAPAGWQQMLCEGDRGGDG